MPVAKEVKVKRERRPAIKVGQTVIAADTPALERAHAEFLLEDLGFTRKPERGTKKKSK